VVRGRYINSYENTLALAAEDHLSDEKSAWDLSIIEKHARELFKIETSRQELGIIVTALRFTI
jgi:hypothetical protein